MADVKRCKGCDFWRTSGRNGGGETTRFCHHLLITGKRRVEVDGVCKSRKERRNGMKKTRIENKCNNCTQSRTCRLAQGVVVWKNCDKSRPNLTGGVKPPEKMEATDEPGLR